ncbi:centromere protein P-like [Ptychodera flava]|uniref:centromere protein P-like n=1 Tax=Ptychodera flava TaxID=63121 RepID=UPI00396AA1C7
MADTSETDLFDTVNQSIERFAESDPGSEFDSVERFIDTRVNLQAQESHLVPKLAFASQRSAAADGVDYAALKEKYSREIEKLRREITILEDEVQRQEDETLEFKESELQQIMSHFRDTHELDDDDDDAEDLNAKMKINSLFTEINFTDVINKVLEHSKEQTRRRQTVWGECFNLEFRVEFDVTETHTNDDKSEDNLNHTRASITRLKINIDERLNNEIREFIKRLEEEKNLQKFFPCFETCCQWYQYRLKTFEYFRQLYPDVVRVLGGPNGNTIQFVHPAYSGPVFKIQWKMKITPQNKLAPSLDMYVKAPKQLSRIDRNGTLRSMPAKFRQMVKHLGIERAIDCIIKSTCTYSGPAAR